MTEAGKIVGDKLVALFDELVEKKIIISMYVLGGEYERLTYVVGVDTIDDQPHLLIDKPDGFGDAVRRAETWKLRFNFNGPDHLEYIFKTRGGQMKGRDLCVPIPEEVERIQRRKNFRVDTPTGARLLFVYNKTKCIIYLVNISLGGAYGVMAAPRSKNARALLKMDQRLYKLALYFPGDEEMEEQTILVGKAQVRRVEYDKERTIHKYAFEFMDIRPEHQQALTRTIYHIQRQLLQRR